jgi:hypothetical protein
MQAAFVLRTTVGAVYALRPMCFLILPTFLGPVTREAVRFG